MESSPGQASIWQAIASAYATSRPAKPALLRDAGTVLIDAHNVGPPDAGSYAVCTATCRRSTRFSLVRAAFEGFGEPV
jgi:hypothetical protein